MAFSPTDNGCTDEERAAAYSRGTVPIYMIY